MTEFGQTADDTVDGESWTQSWCVVEPGGFVMELSRFSGDVLVSISDKDGRSRFVLGREHAAGAHSFLTEYLEAK